MLKKVLTPIVVTIVILVYYSTQTLDFFNSPNVTIETHTDFYDGGTSELQLLEKDKKQLKYSYIVGEVFEYPYVGISVKSNSGTFLYLKKYDLLKIKINTTESNKLILTFYTAVDGFTDIDNFDTYYPLFFEIPVKKETSQISVPLKELKKVHWWLDKNNSLSNMDYPNLSSVVYFELSNSSDFPKGKKDIVTIDKLEANKDINRVILNLVIALFLYYLIFVVSKVISYKNKKSLKVISYKSLNLEDDINEDNSIELFISENYMNPDLCITMISDKLGMTTKQVSEGINRKFNITFPFYLNLIRINEAKRLLLETDKKIIDIAIEVGYNSPVHFNRIFKKIENTTPKKYRDIK